MDESNEPSPTPSLSILTFSCIAGKVWRRNSITQLRFLDASDFDVVTCQIVDELSGRVSKTITIPRHNRLRGARGTRMRFYVADEEESQDEKARDEVFGEREVPAFTGGRPSRQRRPPEKGERFLWLKCAILPL